MSHQLDTQAGYNAYIADLAKRAFNAADNDFDIEIGYEIIRKEAPVIVRQGNNAGLTIAHFNGSDQDLERWMQPVYPLPQNTRVALLIIAESMILRDAKSELKSLMTKAGHDV